MIRRGLAVASCLLLLASAASARELGELAAAYRDALVKLGGPVGERAKKAEQHVAPILAEVAELDSERSLEWLATEIDNDKVVAEARALIPAAMLAHTSDRAFATLLAGFARRAPLVQVATAEALASTKRDPKAGEREIVRSAVASMSDDARAPYVKALGRLETPAALQAALGLVDSGRGRRGAEGDPEVERAVVAAFAKSKSAELASWLGSEGVSAAGSSPGRLIVVARLVGELGAESARGDLEALVNHRSPRVSSAAIEALSKIGLGGAADSIAKVVDKGRRGDVESKIRALDALAGSGSDAGVAAVIKAAKSRDSETRAIAMGSLALVPGNAEAMDALFAGLSDRDTDVRNAALRSVGRLRYKPMVGALVEALATTKDRSFQVRVLDLLVAVSGQNFALRTEDWQKWWSFNEKTFEFPKGEAAGQTKVIVRDLSYFGIEVSSKRLAFIVDISSSMREVVPVKEGSLDDDEDEVEGTGRTRVRKPRGGDGDKPKVKDGKAAKIDILKRELSRLLRKLTADTAVNIVSFDATFKPWQKTLQPLAGSGRQKAVDYVLNLQTGSGTNVFDTLEFVLEDKRVDTIYLLTDGVPTRGRLTDPAQILEEVRLKNRVRAVTIHTIAFGEKSAFLEKLAEENGGQYRFVDSY